MFDAQEVDDSTTVMYSGLLRWFPLRPLKDVFINGEDKEFFLPAFSNPRISSTPTNHISRHKVNPFIPKTQREEKEEMARFREVLEANTSKPQDNSFSIALLIIFGPIALIVIIATIFWFLRH